ncbi:MAG: S1C family serine protease [Patescibacteria group bacterium]
MSYFKFFIFTMLVLAAGTGIFFFTDTDIVPKGSAEATEFNEQESTIRAIEKTMPAVVNITVQQAEEVANIEMPSGEKTMEEKMVEKGSGTGFIMSSDGYIITNKHVIRTDDPENTQYRVIFSSGKKYYAQLIDKDPLNDLAVLKIYDKELPSVDIGNSKNLKVGATVMAIGNALGEYQNTVTKGIVSGLGRSLQASGNGATEFLSNIIQTDAEINLGNSGGPLIDLEGNVVGVNVAVDQRGSDIGFAIPIDDVKPIIDSIRESGIIVRPRLGVQYAMLDPQIAQEKEVEREWGALVIEGEEGPAVADDSPAEQAGLVAGDVIFEINAIKIKDDNDLRSVIQNYKPGDRIGMKIQREGKIFIREAELDKFKAE